MAMNVSAGAADDAPVAEINVTPLVDVMLVLLIIFMVTAPLMISQVPVTLPKASLDEMGKPVNPLILSTDLQGKFYLEENSHTSEFSEDQLQAHLNDMYGRYQKLDGKENFPAVYVRADNKAPYGKVYKLVKTLAKTGFYKVSLISEANQ